ncbi:hypothetical protein ABH521_006815 [Staphylococcus warneri]|uniref:hypothetical protein n=1 Tax=Staphylococcus warneri TaxID=1292 RepID=UPI00325FEB41
MFQGPIMQWLGVALVVFCMIMIAIKVMQNMIKLQEKIKCIALELDSWLKYIISIAFFVLLTIGIYQFTLYFMSEDATLWAILFPVTLVVLLSPYIIIFLPIFKIKFYWGIISIILWSLIIAMPLTYGINVLMTSKMKYNEVGAIAYSNGDEVYKYVGGASLIIVALFSMIIISVKAVTKSYIVQNEETE